MIRSFLRPGNGEGNGFKFKRYDAKEFLDSIKEALRFYTQPKHWRQLLRNAMTADFSWRSLPRPIFNSTEGLEKKKEKN